MSIGLSSKLRLVRPGVYKFFCPGCDDEHLFNTHAQDHPKGLRWFFSGELRCPTVTPALHQEGRCRVALTLGVLDYLPGTTHALSGQCVPLPDFPVIRGA